MPDSDSTPHSVELGSDSDASSSSSEQDEVIHSLPQDVKEHFGMLVFAKVARHQPYPAVIWDPRFSLPKVKKTWYQSRNKDKEYIVEWLGYDEGASMWNKVAKRGIEETKLGLKFDEKCKQLPDDTVYQKGCKEIRRALEEGITNKQRLKEQKKNKYHVQQVIQTPTAGRKNRKGRKLKTQQSPHMSRTMASRTRHKPGGGGGGSSLNIVPNDDGGAAVDTDENTKEMKIRRSKCQNLSQRAKSIELELEDDEHPAAAEVSPRLLKRTAPSDDEGEAKVKKTQSNNSHYKLKRRKSSRTSKGTLPCAEESMEQRKKDDDEHPSAAAVSSSLLQCAAMDSDNKEEITTKVKVHSKNIRQGSLTRAKSMEEEQPKHDEDNESLQSATIAASSPDPLVVHAETEDIQGVPSTVVPPNDEGEKELQLEGEAAEPQQHKKLLIPVAAAIQSSPYADGAEKPAKKILVRKRAKGNEMKLPPVHQIDTPFTRVAQCVERLKAAIDVGNTEDQLDALDKLEDEKFDFEVMKNARAGKIVSKLVRKSHDVVVSNRAGALEMRWRGLLESKDQNAVQEEGIAVAATTAVTSPSSTVSYLQQEPVSSLKHQPPNVQAQNTVAPPKSTNLVEDLLTSSTSKYQHPPLVVANPTPKLDAMALLEDVMLPGFDSSTCLLNSPQPTESNGTHSSSAQQIAVPKRYSTITTESVIGLEVHQSSTFGAATSIQHLDFVRKRGLSLLTMGLCKSHCSGPTTRSPSKDETEKASEIESAIFAATSNMVDSMPQGGNAYRDRVRVISMLLGNGEKSGQKLYRKVMNELIVVDDLVRKTPLELLCWVE